VRHAGLAPGITAARGEPRGEVVEAMPRVRRIVPARTIGHVAHRLAPQRADHLRRQAIAFALDERIELDAQRQRALRGSHPSARSGSIVHPAGSGEARCVVTGGRAEIAKPVQSLRAR
jgi:hypothetical protein